MSSPSGRRKFREIQERRRGMRPSEEEHSATPSWTKASQLLDDGGHDATDEDDDEETLQLKLAAIEARLKLKKLQQGKKGHNAAGSFEEDDVSRPSSSFDSSHKGPNRLLSERKRKVADLDQEESVQVPASPTKRPSPTNPISPKRVTLGIDKGVKGSDVLLRRPGSAKAMTRPNPSGRISRNDTPSRLGHSVTSTGGSFTPGGELRRGKSFSERMAESRIADKRKQDRARELQLKRSAGFTVDKEEIRQYHVQAETKSASSQLMSPNKPERSEEFSREDVLNAFHRPSSALRQTQNTPHSRSDWRVGRVSEEREEKGRISQPSPGRRPTSSRDQSESLQSPEVTTADPSKFEAFSGLHLSSRILPHSFLKRTLKGKFPIKIPDLLRTVKAPSFDPPEVDGDYVVFGIVASKSEPRSHKEGPNVTAKAKDPFDDGSNNTSRYMALTLTDLKWTIDLFLFATAFPRYYRLTPGTLIAILNPSTMPPPPHKTDTNRFSLTLSSSDDTILEVGKAQDLGFCKAVRKDGRTCDSWVDSRKTEFCEFHVELQLRKTTSHRMEVNGGPSILGPGGRSGSRTGNLAGQRGGRELQKEGAGYDRATGSSYYVAPPIPGAGNSGFPGHRSAARLLDAEDDPFLPSGSFHRGGQQAADRFQKRLADQERERNIARKLGEFGGVGAEYLRRHNEPSTGEDATRSKGSRTSSNTTGSDAPNTPKPSMRDALGLNSRTRDASAVKLGPMKKRALDGARKDDGVKSSGCKKTRFITANGIREAGRDSLGLSGLSTDNVDYDDDLDIV